MSKEYMRKYYLDNKEKIKKTSANYFKKNKQRTYDLRKKRGKDLRIKVLDQFGGKCIKCGFDNWKALQIDHIRGGGCNEIKEKYNYSYPKYYKHLLSLSIEEFSKDYQILCANCNWIKRYNENEVRKRAR